ncbi:terminase small subunit [Tundrisphaera lichenicola]|uniref:terminase small subunit n=1 Tax=Tundrisphaera lichenicola TaxID=2029860 RepID=UPI003EB8F2D6
MSDKLTPKQEAFCLRYIETGNATEAYRLAYDAGDMKPASISRKAFELLENVKITAYLAELKARQLKRHDVTVDRVLAEYAKLAFLDIRKAFDEQGNLKGIHELDDDTAAAIAGLEVEVKRTSGEVDEELEGQPHDGALRRQHGTTARLHKIKLSDKRAALDSLARHLGMFVDRSEVTHRKPITEMTDEELDAEIAEYERASGAVLPSTEG